MFDRLKEAIQVLSFREPSIDADIVIVAEAEPVPPSQVSRYIARVIEGTVGAIFIGFGAARIVEFVTHAIGRPSVSITAVGATGALLFWIWHQLLGVLQTRVQGFLKFEEKIAPFFGHKINTAYRILRG